MKKRKNNKSFFVFRIFMTAAAFILILSSCNHSNVRKSNEGKSSQKKITGFVFSTSENPVLAEEAAGRIEESKKEITVTVPKGTGLKNLVPSVKVSEKAIVSPASGVPQDFSKPVNYTVTSEDKSTASYTVKVFTASEQAGTATVTFKVRGGFGYLNAKCKEVSGRTASGAAISVEEGGTVIFTAEPMQGFEVKEWKIENAEFFSGGTAKNNEAQAKAERDFTVTVEFKSEEKPEEPAQPVTFKTLLIGNAADFEEDYETVIKPVIEKIKNGDETQTLKSKQPEMKISFFTKEEMTDVILDGNNMKPDLGEPCYFTGKFYFPEAGSTKTVTVSVKAKGNRESKLSFKVTRLAGKVAMPESPFKLFIDGEEVSSYVYSHLSDAEEASLPVLQTKNEQAEICVKTKESKLAGKVIFNSADYQFNGDEEYASFFTVTGITETEKIISFDIEAAETEKYYPLKWRFKIKKVKTIKPVTALLFADNKPAPFEVKEHLTDGSPGTLEVGGASSLISVRTYEAHAIERVTIDGKSAVFRKKSSGAKYRYESTVENISGTAREIVIVITPKNLEKYDETEWRFNIKTKGAEDIKDIFLYVNDKSVPEEVSAALTSTEPAEMSVDGNTANITVKKLSDDVVASVTVDGQNAEKTEETSSLTGETVYCFSCQVQNITAQPKLIKIIITPKDPSKHKPLIWHFKVRQS